MAQSLSESIRNIPPVTRFFTITTVIVCFAHSLHLIQATDLLCYLPIVQGKLIDVYVAYQSGSILATIRALLWLVLQSYRFFTSFLVPLGLLNEQKFSAIMDIYFFYTFANHLESYQGKFRRNFPDCLWFTLLTGTIIVLLMLTYNIAFDPQHFPIHHQMMLSCVTYIWSRSSKNSLINFLGLFPIKAYYLPLFNLFFKLIVDGYSSFFDTFVGILGGYLYQCIQSDTLPFYNLFPGAYSRYASSSSDNSGRRVGTMHRITNPNVGGSEFIQDSVFDKGYLKAPLFLYSLLNYPINNSKRSTAFYPKSQFNTTPGSNLTPKPEEENPEDIAGQGQDSGSNYSWFSVDEKVSFRGKGRRLGD